MRRLLVVGDDKIGHKFLSHIDKTLFVKIILDKSSDIKRAWRLYRSGSMKLSWLFQIVIAEFLRDDSDVSIAEYVKNNGELYRFICQFRIDIVYLFRAGLIISKKVIDSGAVVLNTHCACLPDYGGLGAISRALHDGAYDQCATLHKVVELIDSGEIIDIVPYKSYCSPNLRCSFGNFDREELDAR